MKKGVAFLTLVLLINLSTAYNGITQTGNYNYVSSNYFSFTVFRNYQGFYDWKQDFLRYQNRIYEKVKIRNYNQSLTRLKNRVKNLTEAYLKNKEAVYQYNSVKIPVLILEDGRELHKNLKIYYNGKIIKPKSYLFLGNIEVHSTQNSGRHIQISSTKQYHLYLYTFNDKIANKSVVFSIDGQTGMKQRVQLNDGFLPKDSILPFD